MLLHITRSLLRLPTCRWRTPCNKKSRDWITSWKILFYERPVNINVNFSRKFSDTDAKTDVSRYDCVTSSSIMHTLKSLFTQFFGRCDLKRECISYSFNVEKVPRISTTTEIDWLCTPYVCVNIVYATFLTNSLEELRRKIEHWSAVKAKQLYADVIVSSTFHLYNTFRVHMR